MMLASLIVGALAVVTGSAPLAAARPASALPADAADTVATGTELRLEHGALRHLHSQRQTGRQARSAQRRERGQKARRERKCLRSGGCGGSTTGSTTFSTIVTVEEDEQQEVVKPGGPEPVVSNRLAFFPPRFKSLFRFPPPKPAPRFKSAFRPPPPKPAPPPPPAPAKAADDGKWVVCVNGGKQTWGPMTGRKPEGLTVWADGSCELAEYAGGFDGYWSVDAGDGHEDGFASAVKAMLRDTSAGVGASVGKNHPRNARVNKFMQDLRDRTNPLDMDYPRDAAMADGGERMANIRKASAVCTQMISVRRC